MNIKLKLVLVSLLILFSVPEILLASVDTLSVSSRDNRENWLYLGSGKKVQPLRKMEVSCDVAVIGAGMSGISAAVAAARQGADVILINDRPVLGGNASSEMRITVNGAPFERETGIIEEILIENKLYNPQESYPIWDHVLYNYVVKNENITLMLNTSMVDVNVNNNKIESAVCWQQPSETQIVLNAPIFIDCTGDGVLGARAGAEYRTGREGKEEFGETFAPDKPDGWVMGETIMMISKDMGKPTPFYPPSYAIPYNGNDDKHRKIKNLKEGFWWVELGSEFDIIADRDENRHNLMAYFYGVWDYIKNSGKFPEAENLALDWVGSLPGKRESRRLEGDYMLSERDMIEHVHFDDAVAYGGWSLDEHCEGGILSLDKPASYFHAAFEKYYEIPYRCIYSKNIENLFFAGRDASVSHIALSSTRIIGTCCMLGQAAGVASAMCSEKGISPRDIYNNHIDELQERMLRQDYFIPNRPAEDNGNLVKTAKKFTASSTASGSLNNLLDGISRPVEGKETHWESADSTAVINIEWKKPVKLSSVEFKFDTNLKRYINMHKDPEKGPRQNQVPGVPPELVKSYTVSALVNGEWVELANVENNITRYSAVEFSTVETKELKVSFNATHGAKNIKLFELRCY